MILILGYWDSNPKTMIETNIAKNENASPYQANENADKKIQTDRNQNSF
jgi:hypothetical protein